ncbi:MAG: extracellular solute-binding protein [Planktotalea sp.]|jgi:ABC-type glycerol-3-phosphate transport system substrate-binding protein|uniref:extracellular solute-binding protein n=1 Tax=Planktotalea sp. TaxID=2029877 RepID=UPI000183A623|nr:extracellular solute-binding protein [Planktotalea sp.]EDZ42671.1 extracellular solute-binding protein, family 1 [Rhodobacteraceae bacterium HTCC2083]MBT5822342.1 extracellular solute-binding protein [Paracoccaceae bacterium]MDG1078086.1 extracellular solute-binding protein [Planktotalea sp.]MDG1084863.1 extracellular solute-binding protein [Planktotalea sp.]HCW85512.1 sugar ABC transporter substrate-binding protein [Paracoccaceae bacterium]
MYSWKNFAATTAFAVLSGTTAMASCGVDAGRVSIVGNEFPAIKTVAAGAASCAGLDVSSNLTADHQKINVAGMSGDPAEYTSAIIANSSVVALINEDVVRPLDDLVAAHGADIPKNQLITIDGKIYAVAFMANAQTLAYRADALEKIGMEPPATYEDMLAAAEKMREMGIAENPIGGAYKAGWNLAEEFVNMYIGHGGEFFKPGSAEVAINNGQGKAALEMMKALTAYMNPDYLTHDSNATNAEMEAGNVMMMNMWGSRMGNLMDDEGAEPEVYENIKVGAPMTVGGGSIPASTLWWDGWTVAKNVSDEDATATFLAMKNGVSPSILTDETMTQAVWMIDGYTPGPVNDGVFAAINMSAQPYPMLPFMGLLHTALGDNIGDFLQGKESAEQALTDIEAAYSSAAKEKGFLQ